MLIDTHAHLYAEHFADDLPNVIRRATDEGVEHILIPNVDRESIEPLVKLCQSYPEVCYPMVGVHPTSIKGDYEQELAMVEEWLNKHRFIAIGEIGIDLYWDKTFIKEQKLAFAQQIKWAIERKLPIAIHSREAFNETMEVLGSEYKSGLSGVFHSFSGTLEQAKEVIDIGFKIGVSGVVTFKNSGLDKVIKEIGLEHLVIETDAPYLTPVPHRGKRNESAYVSLVAKKIAELLHVDVKTVAEQTTKNTKSLFLL